MCLLTLHTFSPVPIFGYSGIPDGRDGDFPVIRMSSITHSSIRSGALGGYCLIIIVNGH